MDASTAPSVILNTNQHIEINIEEINSYFEIQEISVDLNTSNCAGLTFRIICNDDISEIIETVIHIFQIL